MEQKILPYSRWANALLSTSSDDPRTFRQALPSPNKEAWMEVINKELNSMASLNVWEVINLDTGYRLIGMTHNSLAWITPRLMVSKGLLYSKVPCEGITTYSNADLGNCRVSQQFVSGYLETLKGFLLFWKTWKQPYVSLSTAEAEYKALCDLTSELLWLCRLVKEFCLFSTIYPIVVQEDNQSCINAANGDCNVNKKRMKHVIIKLHFIK
ncbi:hypothetical protein O181_060875 [Austropuccinia psidii MF-1]|uniref:Reverse transcriptase Ty1/copia-type domain-containing protein n=1 Tax=Austropuccinia psidii MF-1 TaxID=1389203 RepID=A0A9Q3EE45_9BASI|nr:hypothetical protein [Austropuccinia psidii MF-1]